MDKKMLEAVARADAEAEQALEELAAFGPGVAVVNLATGEARVTREVVPHPLTPAEDDPARPVINGLILNLGETVMTCGVREKCDAMACMVALTCHTLGDWGSLDPEDWKANNRAALDYEKDRERSQDRVLSSDMVARADGVKETTRLWIITEWAGLEFRGTPLLLPEEY